MMDATPAGHPSSCSARRSSKSGAAMSRAGLPRTLWLWKPGLGLARSGDRNDRWLVREVRFPIAGGFAQPHQAGVRSRKALY